MKESSYTVFTFEDGLVLKESEKHICNFCVSDVSLVNEHLDGKITPMVKFKLIFQDGQESGIFIRPLSNIEKIDWFEIDNRCLINPLCREAKTCIAYTIKSGLSDAPVEELHVFSHADHYRIEDVPVVLLGDKLFIPKNKEHMSNFVRIESGNNFAIDTERYSEYEAAEKVLQVADLCPNGSVILAFHLFNLLQPIYKEIGIVHSFIPYILGESGMKKTSYVSYMTQVLNNDQGIQPPPRLNATLPAVESLLKQGIGVLVLDDLFPPAVKSIETQQEKLLTEIVRIVADGSPRAKISGGKVIPTPQMCGVIITGEYELVSNPSTISRILTLDFSSPIDNSKFHEFQQQPLLVPTFMNYFLQWAVENLGIIKDALQKRLTEFRTESDLDVHGKLGNAYFCLTISFEILFGYFIRKGLVIQDEATEIYEIIRFHVRNLVIAQDNRVRKAQKKETCYMEIISELYEDNAFKLGISAKSVKKHDYDGFIKGKILYLRSNRLLERVQDIEPSATFPKIKYELDKKEALKHHNGDKTVNVDGLRFYAIYLKKLDN